MLEGVGPVWQALLGSLFTWGVTALGAAGVWVLDADSPQILDASLGLAAGVMTAASFWSLLAPALEMVSDTHGRLSWLPVSVGFALGAAFVYAADRAMPLLGLHDSLPQALVKSRDPAKDSPRATSTFNSPLGQARRRKKERSESGEEEGSSDTGRSGLSWRRVMLLVVAITVHNIPEGLAVGVGFGAVGSSASATLGRARTLAVGIGLQNLPEGLAVSLPLVGLGWGRWRSWWWGQVSGAVEPVAAVLGAVAVDAMQWMLPYALSFAAGAMIYVVLDDIVPEASSRGNGKTASAAAIAGFLLMMALDVGLG